MARRAPRVRRTGGAGFTLVELLVVVTIVGVLAAVGVVLLRKYIFSSKTVEAVSVIQAIRTAEERYRAEHQTYFEASPTKLWYPNKTPGKTASYWKQPSHDHYALWQRLNVAYEQPVQFGYMVNAGLPGQNHTVPETADKNTGWPDPAQEPWYVIQAKADADGDGTFAYFVASSYNAEIYSENEGE